jgi:hypothetical protein
MMLMRCLNNNKINNNVNSYRLHSGERHRDLDKEDFMKTIIQVGLKRLFFLFQCVLVVSLAACGNGGGGGSSAAPAPTPTSTTIPFNLFPAGYFTNGYTKTFHLTGSDTQGGTYTGTITETTQAQSVYNAQPVIPVQTLLNLTNTKTNAFVTATGYEYFSTDINNLMSLGSTDSIGDIYTAISLNVVPKTAMIGASGAVGTYSGSGTAAGETVTLTWQLTNANNGLANLIVTNSTYIGATLDSSEKHTTVIDQQGNSQTTTIEIYYASSGVTITLYGS